MSSVALQKSSWVTLCQATVPLLCLNEKGYSNEEYIIRQVDISACRAQLSVDNAYPLPAARGENFSPSYLK